MKKRVENEVIVNVILVVVRLELPRRVLFSFPPLDVSITQAQGQKSSVLIVFPYDFSGRDCLMKVSSRNMCNSWSEESMNCQ